MQANTGKLFASTIVTTKEILKVEEVLVGLYFMFDIYQFLGNQKLSEV